MIFLFCPRATFSNYYYFYCFENGGKGCGLYNYQHSLEAFCFWRWLSLFSRQKYCCNYQLSKISCWPEDNGFFFFCFRRFFSFFNKDILRTDFVKYTVPQLVCNVCTNVQNFTYRYCFVAIYVYNELVWVKILHVPIFNA